MTPLPSGPEPEPTSLEHLGSEDLRRLVRAMVDVSSHLELPRLLERIVATASSLVHARYGALGVLDPTRSFLSQFITVGLNDDEREVIGDLPRGHGILGMLILDPKPIRLPDLNVHPDSFGYPPGHPPMKSFLGVPLVVRGEAFGNLYLTDKVDDADFTEADEEVVLGLAAAAAVAIDNAQLHQRIRDLDLLADRERIARDLHDTVIQRLFATGLSLQATTRLSDDPTLLGRLKTSIDDLDETVREIRSVIFGLQGADRLPGGSIRRDLLRLGTDMAEVIGTEPRFRFHGPVDNAIDDDLAQDLLTVAREAFANAAKHAHPTSLEATVTVREDWLELLVVDNGSGPPPPDKRSGDGQGLRNLRERAEARGGWSDLAPALGGGARLTWRVPITI